MRISFRSCCTTEGVGTEGGHEEVVQILLGRRVVIEKGRREVGLLAKAIGNRKMNVMKMFVEGGYVQVEEDDGVGGTLLNTAVLSGRLDVGKYDEDGSRGQYEGQLWKRKNTVDGGS